MAELPEAGVDTSRREIIKARVSKAEHITIKTNADRHSQNISDFIRTRTLGDMEQSPRPTRRKGLSASEARSVAITLACMGRLADIIRDYEDMPPAPQDLGFMFRHLLRELEDNRDRCFEALGKKP